MKSDNINELYDSLLTDQNIDDIVKTLNDNKESNSNLKLVSDIYSGKIDTSVDLNKVKQEQYATINIDPNTGEKKLVSVEDEEQVTKPFSESLTDISVGEYDSDFSVDDVKSNISNLEILDENEDFTISDASALQLLKIINRIKNNENFNIYKELPLDVKEIVDRFCDKKGAGRNIYSSRANMARNKVTEMLIKNYMKYISKKKYDNGIIKSLENFWRGSEKELIEFYKSYENSPNKYINIIKESDNSITDENFDDVKIIAVLESLYDSYHLKKFREYAKKIKIKHIEFEKPSKVFSDIESKYRDTDEFNIHSLETALLILNRHNKNENFSENNLKFLLGFCKFCMNYKVDNIIENAFIVNVLNNIILLDILEKELYDQFADEFINNINEIALLIRGSL